jgi:NADPH2:quinone reductase
MSSRAWFVDHYGGPERLLLRDRSGPVPGESEVVLRTAAIGLNFADLFVRAGVYPNTPRVPFVPGMEVSGVVESVGSGVTGLAAGRKAVAVPIFGGHAEKVACPAARVFPLPDGADLVEAAAMPVVFLTAHHAISEAHVRSGERAVVTAAAGGVGTALLQLLAASGARTLALVGSETKLDLCRRLGAEEAGTYDAAQGLLDKSFGGRADVVFDAIGGKVFRSLWRRLDRGGRFLLYGFAAAAGGGGASRWRAVKALGAMGLLMPYSFVQSCRSLTGFNLSLLPARTGELRKAAEEIFRQWTAGKIRPVIGERFPFERLPDAHRALASRKTFGKVLVEVGGKT